MLRSGVQYGHTGTVLGVLELVPELAAEAVVQLSIVAGHAGVFTVVERYRRYR